MEISFEDNKIDETMSSPCIYEHVKNAVQEAHGDYGRACLARSLRGTLSIYLLPKLSEQSQLRSIKLSLLSFLKNVPFSTSPLPHSGVFFKRPPFYNSFSALIVFIVFNFS